MRHWKKAAHHRDRKHALWTGAMLVIICVGSLYIANHVIKPSDQLRNANRNGFGSASGKQITEGTGDATGDDYLTTGSILYVPLEGNVCRKRLIDNKTWFIRDKGYVICDEAVSWNANMSSPRSSVTRVDAIRSGFLRK